MRYEFADYEWAAIRPTLPGCAAIRHLRVVTAGGGRSPATTLFNQRLYIVAAIPISFQT
jgi:hypothetical protein